MSRQGACLVVWLLAMGWLAASLAGCALHPGGDALVFVRSGQLWTIAPDGSNPHKIASGNVVGFAWSPDHHQLVFRTTTDSHVQAPTRPTAAAPDAPGDLYVTTINGNSPLQISPALALARSDAWWDANGTRLLYRQFYPGPNGTRGSVMYVASQADQPLGIASKTLLEAIGIPTLSPDGSQVVAVDADGAVRVGAPAATGSVVAQGALLALPGTGRPGRVLWQPGQDAILYETASTSASDGATLVLHDLGSGAPRTLATFSDLLDASFSPDGSRLLIRTTTQFSVVNVANPSAPVFAWPDDDQGAIAFWSPDTRLILIEDASGSQLVNPGARTVTPLLAYATASPSSAPSSGLWHPAAGSPWSADTSAVVFAATRADTWHGASLDAPGGTSGGAGASSPQAGLYIGTINSDGTPGAARLIDGANDLAPSWSYADPSTTFLLPS